MNLKTMFLISITIIVAIATTGCPDSGGSQTGGSSESIYGAGASFPAPLYTAWAYDYGEESGNSIDYQSVGSGAGISSIQENTVDFGASDKPLLLEDLEESGLLQFPMIIGGVVPVINLTGVNAGEMKLSEDILADIFLGNILMWNDPALVALNPSLTLPDQPITVVHRADGSGTTWIFSKYLSLVSDEWNSVVGVGKSLDWPVGTGGQGNEGVANYVGAIDGSIGYVEYAYSKENDLTFTLLENQDGEYSSPNAESFASAASNADWLNAPGFYMVLVDQPGANTWPIVGASFILIYKEQEDEALIKSMLDFFNWSLTTDAGKEWASELDYVPIPPNVVELIQTKWAEEITVGGVPVWE